jgi:hypothetical protein
VLLLLVSAPQSSPHLKCSEALPPLLQHCWVCQQLASQQGALLPQLLSPPPPLLPLLHQ